MTRTARWRRPGLILLGLVVAAGGCEKATAPPAGVEPALSAAVAAYLARRDMDLAIAAYKSFRMSDDGRQAEAEIAMRHAGEGPRVTARFRFEFERRDGDWHVVSHTQP